jgi:hypothetical protein
LVDDPVEFVVELGADVPVLAVAARCSTDLPRRRPDRQGEDLLDLAGLPVLLEHVLDRAHVPVGQVEHAPHVERGEQQLVGVERGRHRRASQLALLARG